MMRSLVLLGLIMGSRAQSELAQADATDLTLVAVPAISFFWQAWSPNGSAITTLDARRALPQCSTSQFLITDNPNSPVETVYPLYMHDFPIGLQPQSRLATELESDVYFDWVADLPIGTNFTLAMTDSGGHSGGSVDGYYIVEGFNNCTIRSDVSAPITFKIFPEDNPCYELDIYDIKGGQAPYSVSILAALSGLYGNVTDFEGDELKLVNTIPAGQAFTVVVTDSLGQTANVSPRMTSTLNYDNCDAVLDRGGSGVPLGAIIGAVVGGVLAALLLALLAWWLLRKRSEKAAQRFDAQERAAKGEFRMADGSAPLVTPFVVPVRSPDYSEDASPASAHPSAHEYSKGSSMRDYGYHTALTPIHTAVPPLHPVYSQVTASPTSPASQLDYTSYPSDTSPYESYHPAQFSYHQTETTSTVDGLANPEEFAYRDATWSSANSGPTLPPGAQPIARQPMYD